jgi:hypothetical protein
MITVDHLGGFANKDNGDAVCGADKRWSLHCGSFFRIRA